MTQNKAPPAQASMFDAFAAAYFERQTAHLPGTVAEAIPFYKQLLERHHAAFIAGDIDLASAIATEAENLAIRLNGGRFGFLADEDSSGRVLERDTAAADGQVPLWGQCGTFIVTPPGVRVRVDMAGLFGIDFPSFSAHVVDPGKPFISETGYRSFLGVSNAWQPGMTTGAFARAVLEQHIARDMRGKLVPIGREYRARLDEDRQP